MSGAGQRQALSDKEKLQTEQRTGQQTGAPGGGHLVPTAFPTDQPGHQQRCDTGTCGGLHHRCNVWGCNFDNNLLHAPNKAQS